MHRPQEVSFATVTTWAVHLEHDNLACRDTILELSSNRPLLIIEVIIKLLHKAVYPLHVSCHEFLIFAQALYNLVPCALAQTHLCILDLNSPVLAGIVKECIDHYEICIKGSIPYRFSLHQWVACLVSQCTLNESFNLFQQPLYKLSLILLS